MTDQTVNLNKIRKAKTKADQRAEADANSVTFGRSKAERMLDATRNAKARAMLDAHHVEEEE